MPNIANTSRIPIVLPTKGGESVSIGPGETANIDIDKDDITVAAHITAGTLVVGGTKAEVEKVAKQGTGPATPQQVA